MNAICAKNQWINAGVRFYTGVPDVQDSAFWNHFWTAKGAQMGRGGVTLFTRPLRYSNKSVRLPDGSVHTYLDGNEKGIDVRLALDVIRLAYQKHFDVAIIFSQDQDLSEVAYDLRVIAKDQHRWLKIVSAYPASPAHRNTRGIDKTDWIKIDKPTYDSCIDTRDYRPKIEPLAVQDAELFTDSSGQIGQQSET